MPLSFRCAAVILLLAGLAACEEVPVQSLSGADARAPDGRLCEKASAVAVGFGEEKATGFAEGNLDLAIDKTKDKLAVEGAKGFSIEARKVSCAAYIDFGGAIGREHKCRASALVCGKTG